MRGVFRCVFVLVLVAVLLAIAGLVLVYRGSYNVAATYPDRGAVDWLLSTTTDRSVQRRAAKVRVPPLDDAGMFRLGFQHYRGMCVKCHGGPGIAPEDLAQGLNPAPPLLVEEAAEWEPNELFWITKNGVRMTGMPAWGPTHSDEQIWAMVAFMQRLPKMSEAEYRALDRQVPALPED